VRASDLRRLYIENLGISANPNKLDESLFLSNHP